MDWILKNKQILLIFTGIITLICIAGITRLRISFSFESFYPKDDPEYLFYQAYQERFSEEQNFITYIAVKSPEKNIFDQAFLQEADQLFFQLAQNRGIDSLLSPTRFRTVVRKGLAYGTQALLEFDSPEAVAQSQKRILADTSLSGIFITRNQQYLCAYLIIDSHLFDSPDRDELNKNLVKLLDQSGFEYVISGIPYIRSSYVEKIGKELILFISLAFLLILTVLFLTYRNIWGIIIPQIAVLTSLFWILGFMGWTGQTINLINNLLIPIIFVVGMSDIVHLMTKYLQEIRKGKGRLEAIHTTMREIGLSLLLTSLTTAIGFASLLVSRIPPIRDFGLYAACGVIFTFIISVIIMPVALSRISAEKLLQSRSLENQHGWHSMMSWIHKVTFHYPRYVAIAFLIAISLSLVLITRIPTDTYLIEDISKNDPIRKAMEFFEGNAYGIRPFEMGIEVRDSSHHIMDREILLQIDTIQKFLHKQISFSPFVSPASFISEANKTWHYGRDRYYRIPGTQKQIDELYDLARLKGGNELIKTIVSEDGLHGRMSARMSDIGRESFEKVRITLEDFIHEQCDTSLFTYHITGHAYLTEQNLTYIRSSLLWGLGIAFVVIGLIMGLLFRSWKMLLISMIPNVIPLILTGGFMGLFGIALTASTALVFVIAFGIAVDDTIHFLSRYRLERKKGCKVEESIKSSILGTGKAMLITSFILMGGFILLLMSDFGGTFNTGLFTGLTIIFALLADLFLLPVLLRWVEKD